VRQSCPGAPIFLPGEALLPARRSWGPEPEAASLQKLHVFVHVNTLQPASSPKLYPFHFWIEYRNGILYASSPTRGEVILTPISQEEYMDSLGSNFGLKFQKENGKYSSLIINWWEKSPWKAVKH